MLIHLGDSKSNGGISNLAVTKTSDHTLVITPNRIGSHPPYPSKDGGGQHPIRVRVHSVRPGSPGDVTVGGADPVHPSLSGARSRWGTPPAGPLEAYDQTRPKWWKGIPHTCKSSPSPLADTSFAEGLFNAVGPYWYSIEELLCLDFNPISSAP